MQFLSDLADSAVLLPVTAIIAVTMGVLGQWRWLLAWLAAVGGTLAVMLVLKAGGAVMSDGSDGRPISPSGHVASACVVYGGLALLLLRRVVPIWLLGAVPVAIACVVGYSRIALMAHSPAEVVMGALVGCAGAAVLTAAAGPGRRAPTWPVVAACACTVLACHGMHLHAEQAIDAAFVMR